MGQCQYENLQSEHTCNVDTQLFKDSSQEDLFPDFCYFHRIGEAFENIYLIFDEYIPMFKQQQQMTDEYYYEVASICKDKFSKQINYCPSVNDFYYNLNQIMFGDYVDKLDTSGFYFPINSHGISLNILNEKGRRVCNLEFIFSNIKIYEISFIQDLLRIFSSDKSSNLLGNIVTVQNNRELGFGPNVNNPSNRGVFPLSISNIDFQKNIEINSLRVLKYIIKDCTFNSEKIYIKAEKLEISNNNIFNKTIKNVELSVPFRDLELSNPLSDDSLFRYETKVDIYDGYDYYDDSSMYENQPSTNQPKQGLIQNVNLKNVIFYECNKNQANRKNHYGNLNKLNFVHCQFNKGHSLYEKGIEPKRLEYNYLYLRELYDKRGEYIAGNDFHYNYYEIKREHDMNLSSIDKFMLCLYGYLNGYNTKPARAIGWLGVVFIAFWLVFGVCLSFLKGLKIAGISYEPLNFWSAFGGGFYTALSGLLPTSLISSSITSENIIILVFMHFESLISTVLLVLFIFALRNRFRRTKDPVDIGK